MRERFNAEVSAYRHVVLVLCCTGRTVCTGPLGTPQQCTVSVVSVLEVCLVSYNSIS